jgi:predicted solute-binding protein
MKLEDIKNISITGKEWFDRANGNSYCSARATVNWTHPDEFIIVAPMEYGYGDSYKDHVYRQLAEKCGVSQREVRDYLWNKNIVTSTKQERCLKKEVKMWGEN